MNIHAPMPLLGGRSASTFMKQYWQRKPCVIRQAIPDFEAPVERRELFDLAAHPDVESRLVIQTPHAVDKPWRMRHGPFARRVLPPLKQPGWTLLVQGVDAWDQRVHAILQNFRFVPDARLDDLMVSYATDGGGVGPHFDSYDVFLLQAVGRRRWRIGRQKNLQLQPNMPLKILANFEPEQEFVLEPGDMLYLPPRYAHDGVADGECMTYSIGFRSPSRGEVGREILERLADQAGDVLGDVLYKDPTQVAVESSAQVPVQLQEFACKAVQDLLGDGTILGCVLGEYLTEPKSNVWFDVSESAAIEHGVCLDRRSRMLYDSAHIFINGESFLASGRDAALMRELANTRSLAPSSVRRLSLGAKELLRDWCASGWAHGGG